MSSRILLACLIAAALLVMAAPASAAPVTVLDEDFSGPVNPAFVDDRTSVTPATENRFSGEFSYEQQVLQLENLPAHETVTLTYDLYILRSWDGNRDPDIFTTSVLDGDPRQLLQASFSVPSTSLPQSFPDPYPGPDNPPGTGALATDTLGYGYFYGDAVYRITHTFAHSDPRLEIGFFGQPNEDLANEAWGLDNVQISVDDDPNSICDDPSAIVGDGAANTITGTPEDDVICGKGGADAIRGEGGNDVIVGGDGPDTILDGDGNDRVLAGAGDDVLGAEAGDDVLKGGAGRDRVTYATRTTQVAASLATGTGGVAGETDVYTGIEDLRGGAADDDLTGDAGPNTLTGLTGGDTLRGGGGADAIRGDAGDDALEGGPGDDTISGGAGDDQLVDGAGTDLLLGDDGTDRLDLAVADGAADYANCGAGRDSSARHEFVDRAHRSCETQVTFLL